MLDDETLRDGLQSPSVRTPSIEHKIRLLHLMDALGMDTADIGLPGAGPHVVQDVERLAREIVDAKLAIRPNCAARTVIADIRPIVEVAQRTGIAIECCAFIGSSPIRQYAEDWTLDRLERLSAEAITFAVAEGLPVMYVTEDTTRADPESLRRLYSTAIRAGATRLCIADTVGHATPSGARAVVRFVQSVVDECGGGVGIDWHGHRDRDLAVGNSLAAMEAGATRLHGAALGLGERVGNTPIDVLLANLVLMGLRDADLRHLPETAQLASEACGVPLPHNYPIVGRDAFRTATGVHAAAVIKAYPEGRAGPGGRRLLGRTGQPGRPRAGDRRRPDVRQVERRLLAREARPRGRARARGAHLREGQDVGCGAVRRRDPGAMEDVENVEDVERG
ncbi:MAG: LeuA family protein [Vicinamibacterales bacterium]